MLSGYWCQKPAVRAGGDSDASPEAKSTAEDCEEAELSLIGWSIDYRAGTRLDENNRMQVVPGNLSGQIKSDRYGTFDVSGEIDPLFSTFELAVKSRKGLMDLLPILSLTGDGTVSSANSSANSSSLPLYGQLRLGARVNDFGLSLATKNETTDEESCDASSAPLIELSTMRVQADFKYQPAASPPPTPAALDSWLSLFGSGMTPPAKFNGSYDGTYGASPAQRHFEWPAPLPVITSSGLVLIPVWPACVWPLYRYDAQRHGDARHAARAERHRAGDAAAAAAAP